MNLVCVVVTLSLYSKSIAYSTIRASSKKHINNKYYIFSRLKLLLIYLYIISFLLKIKKTVPYFIKSAGNRPIIKKFFYKIFSIKSFFDSRPLPVKFFFNYYYVFYKDFMEFKGLFSFIKHSFELLKMTFSKFYNLYNKFMYFWVQKFDIKKNLINKYCRSILNFRKKQRIELLSATKKCLLFSKKKYVYTYKFNTPLYIDELRLIYDTFLEGNIIGETGKNIININPLYSKISFSNFLKSSDYLDSFYKEYYFNAYLKKIKHNFYVTLTNRKGGVIFSNSSGKVGLLKKKQKKSMFAINLVIRPAIKTLLKSNILTLKNFFCPISLQYISLKVKYFFLRLGVAIDNLVVFNNKPHNFSCRKLKKQRRM